MTVLSHECGSPSKALLDEVALLLSFALLEGADELLLFFEVSPIPDSFDLEEEGWDCSLDEGAADDDGGLHE